VYLLSGSLNVYVGNTKKDLKQVLLKPDDTITLEPYQIHRMEAVQKSVYLEASTPYLSDVVRLEDEYNRV